ncbi:MAG: HypC/HybG/HupF family hydrogenase formation chaperone [Desulfurococcales archaeon]|nr:HypC/HybG/HupF family hydrogenase formation chaperone [Desulfurococcales archaeon]
MCLGIPAKVLRIWNEGELRLGEVEMGGLKKEVIMSLSDEVKPGDYVIVHAGIAISKIGEEEVEETLKVWDEYLKVLGE